MINNFRDLGIKYFSGDENLTDEELVEHIRKWLYKSTDCGAWIEFDEQGVILGSIVEGSEVDIISDMLLYPFSEGELGETIDWIEDEADMEWMLANEEYGEEEDEPEE